MKKNSNQGKNLEKEVSSQQQAQDLDLRLKRQAFLSMQLQKQLSIVRSQSQYCSSFLQTLKEQHEKLKKHNLLSKSSPFGGWQSKLKQLSVAAISNQSSPPNQTKIESMKKGNSKVLCSQKDHLFDILSDKERQDELKQIKVLELKRDSLYDKISNLVMQEYLNDKIFQKIKREVKKESKLSTLNFLNKEISKYNNWAEQNRHRVQNEMNYKEIEQNVIQNLEQMKLIMNKKIINNDYVFENFEEKGEESLRKVEKIGDLSSKIKEEYQNSLKFFRSKEIQFGFSQESGVFMQKKMSKRRQPLCLAQLQAYLQEVQDTMSNLDQYPPEFELNKECKILESKIDEVTLALKK